ncbi:MAG: MFS transporter [Acidimicrobiales bacterium]
MAYAIVAVLSAANLPTPLYPHYQRVDHLSTATLTVVFVAYVVTVAATLSVAGQASDLFGRRAVLVPALGFSILSAACFATSGALGWLIAGRVASGIASGAVTAAGPAALADLEPNGKVARASTIASAAVVGGLAIGPMLSGLFVRYAPLPEHLVYLVFLVVLAAGLAGVATLPRQPAPTRAAPATSTNTAARLRLGVGQLRRPSVPAGMRSLFVRTAIAFSAGWVGTAMFFALGPTFADLVLHTTDPIVGAAIVFDAFVMSASAQLFSRRFANGPSMRWGLVVFAAGMGLLPLALSQRQPALLVLGAAAAGAGQGITHRATQAALLDSAPPADRGQTAAAFYLVGYLVIAVVLVSLGFLIDAAGPLVGLSSFAALTVSAAAVAVILLRKVAGRSYPIQLASSDTVVTE